MADKMIITQLDGNALIFAPDGSVRVAEQYAELKPEEVLVTENGSSAVLKENGEREIQVNANSGFRFETPPDANEDVNAARRGVEEGEDPSENADPAAGQATSSSTFFVAGDVVVEDAGSRPSLTELLEEGESEESENVESLNANNLTAFQLSSLSSLQRFFFEQLNEATQTAETADVTSSAPTTPGSTPSPDPSPTDSNQAPSVTLSMLTVTEQSVIEGQVVATITTTDANNDAVSLNLLDNEDGYFRIQNDNVVLTQVGVDAINNDALGLESMSIVVEADDGELSEQASGVLAINKVNDNVPTLTLETVDVTEESVFEGMVVATFSASDADGNTLSYTLTDNNNGYFSLGDGEVLLTAAGVEAINNDALNIESLGIFLTVSDGDFQASASDTISVIRVNDNGPTVNISTSDISESAVTIGLVVATVTTADADGDNVTLSLVGNEDNYFLLSDGEVTLTADGVTAVQDDGLDIRSLTISVQASDGENVTDASATLLVGRDNDTPPTLSLAVEGLTEESVTESTLVATITTSDEDGDDVSLTLLNNDEGYFRLDGNGVYLTADGVAAINQDGVDAISSVPISVQAFDGTYTVVASDTVAVARVNDNSPVITLNETDVMEESVSVGTVVATISASDADGDDLTFTVSGPHADWVTIDGNEVKLTAAGVEAINDDDAEISAINFTVTASDGSRTGSDDANVTVTRVNDNDPVITLTEVGVAEESVSVDTVVATISASDADENELTFTISGANADWVTIDGNEVKLTAAGVEAINDDDAEISAINFTVTASDGSRTVSDDANVTVTRVNDNDPVITLTEVGVAEESVSVDTVVATISASDADENELTFTISGANADWVTIDGNEVKLTAAGVAAINDDGAEISAINFTVTASDGSRTGSDDANVTVTRVNDNDPVIALTEVGVAEESVSVDTVVATISASDADENELTFTISGANADWVTIDGNEVKLTAAGVAAINDDGAEISAINFTVSASDGSRTGSDDANVTVTRVNDNAPELTVSVNELTEENVAENDVVATLSATDVDENILTYSLSNNGAGYFTLVGNQVLLTAAGAAAINSDSAADPLESLSFTVGVSDGTYVDSENVSVTVNRVDDIVAANDSDEIAASSTATGNVISGSNGDGSGADTLTSPSSVNVSQVTYDGVDYVLTDGSVTISADSGQLTVSSNGDYTFTSSVQTEFYASELNTAFDSTNGVTFYGSNLTSAAFLSGDAGNGLNLDEVHHPSHEGIVEHEVEEGAIIGTDGDDTIDAGNGADIVYAGAGNDTVSGGNGVDEIYGEAGNDILSGDNAEDHLYGGDDNDTLDGGRGNDRLVGGAGDDELTLGKGSDTVVFESGDDTVMDFDTNNDTIIIKNASTIDTFAELGIEQVGENTVITLDTGTLTLNGVDKDDLTADMFTFDTSDEDGEYSASIYGFDDEVDEATLTVSDLADNEVVDWFLYDVSGNVVGTGSSTVTDGKLSLSSPVDTTFRYVALDVENITVETIFAELTTHDVDEEIFTYTLADSDSNSAQAQLTLSYDDNSRVVADIDTVQTLGLNGDITAHIAKGNLFDNDVLSGTWSFESVQFEGATYHASEGVMIIETQYGSLTIYGQSDEPHTKGDYVYQLMTDVPSDDVLESFHYTLVNESGLRIQSVLDIRVDDNADADADLSDLINTTELTGDENANLLVGRDESDTLQGNGGNDILDGGLGEDLLIGGAGDDELTGGEGRDVFQFLRGDADSLATDTLTDFDVSMDVLDLSDLLDGLNNESIEDYLVSLSDKEGKATLTVGLEGEADSQVIVFENKSLDQLSQDLGISGSSGSEILGKMIDDGILITSV
ncbi:type I secretion C-terminal target domain-containing protein [Grimontia sp. S25]|uniref:Type I secretion C-terminal target domain-containing protein n=1 Tax=Grimontia sedimenti TaxID=2711294 RepID=A0A6M1RNC9_9GAMM|nr:type I secretion C-terminal target domain-containing protein [Grimontia sedimenti]NGN97557.1 type I secretion C-terminal target domain-containing protein [Grimontia sedimenti]